MDAAAARSLSLRRGLSGIGQIAKARRGAAIIMANRVAAQSKKYHAAARHLSALSTCGAGAARPHIQGPGRTGLALNAPVRVPAVHVDDRPLPAVSIEAPLIPGGWYLRSFRSTATCRYA